MKKFFLPIAAALVLSATFLSCKKEDNRVKLLLSVADGGNTMYEYDTQNRLSKISKHSNWGELYSTRTLTYSKYDLVKFDDFILTATGLNQLTFSDGSNTHIFDLNSDGTLAKSSSSYANGMSNEANYEYQNGNLTKRTGEFFDGETLRVGTNEFTYDSMNSPFLNCKTPRWWLIWSFGGDIGVTKNNVTGWTYVSDEESSGAVLSYEYDDEGYPTKREWNDSGFFVYYSYNK